VKFQWNSQVKEILDLDYAVLARVKGFSETQVILRDALKNAALPTLTLVGVVTILLLLDVPLALVTFLPFPLLGVVFFVTFEILVSFLQAYVFVLLAGVYIDAAVSHEH
jgi:ABC-type antimicrobial peptide transport system permease subunit